MTFEFDVLYGDFCRERVRILQYWGRGGGLLFLLDFTD